MNREFQFLTLNLSVIAADVELQHLRKKRMELEAAMERIAVIPYTAPI